MTATLSNIKSTEVTIIKTVKTPPSCVKLIFGAMCVLVGVGPEKVTEAQAKKNVTMNYFSFVLPSSVEITRQFKFAFDGFL